MDLYSADKGLFQKVVFHVLAVLAFANAVSLYFS